MSVKYEASVRKAQDLFYELVPNAREAIQLRGSFVVRGSGKKAYQYELSPFGQTEIYDRFGRHLAHACLLLTEPAPVYDRMIAEYLMIKNAEDLYWKTANIYHRNDWNPVRDAWCVLLICLNAGLLVNLILRFL